MNSFFDSHMHTTNSIDGKNSVAEMCKSAYDKGLIGICITDHCDINLRQLHNDGMKNVDTYNQVQIERKNYNGNFIINSGIELAQSLFFPEEAARIISLVEWDFVIGSLHFTSNLMEISDQDFANFDSIDFLHDYYSSLVKTAEITDYDTLAHITFPFRYLAKYKVDYNIDDFRSYFESIFDILINRSKSLEVNCSGLRQSIMETFPNTELIKLYRAMGGREITISSDAHNIADVGKGVGETIPVLKKLGFDYYNVYFNRIPKKFEL